MTGKEPYYPTEWNQSEKGITIAQKALLEFMVAMQAQYGPHNAAICADAAKEFTDAYINKLNEL